MIGLSIRIRLDKNSKFYTEIRSLKFIYPENNQLVFRIRSAGFCLVHTSVHFAQAKNCSPCKVWNVKEKRHIQKNALEKMLPEIIKK